MMQIQPKSSNDWRGDNCRDFSTKKTNFEENEQELPKPLGLDQTTSHGSESSNVMTSSCDSSPLNIKDKALERESYLELISSSPKFIGQSEKADNRSSFSRFVEYLNDCEKEASKSPLRRRNIHRKLMTPVSFKTSSVLNQASGDENEEESPFTNTGQAPHLSQNSQSGINFSAKNQKKGFGTEIKPVVRRHRRTFSSMSKQFSPQIEPQKITYFSPNAQHFRNPQRDQLKSNHVRKKSKFSLYLQSSVKRKNMSQKIEEKSDPINIENQGICCQSGSPSATKKRRKYARKKEFKEKSSDLRKAILKSKLEGRRNSCYMRSWSLNPIQPDKAHLNKNTKMSHKNIEKGSLRFLNKNSSKTRSKAEKEETEKEESDQEASGVFSRSFVSRIFDEAGHSKLYKKSKIRKSVCFKNNKKDGHVIQKASIKTQSKNLSPLLQGKTLIHQYSKQKELSGYASTENYSQTPSIRRHLRTSSNMLFRQKSFKYESKVKFSVVKVTQKHKKITEHNQNKQKRAQRVEGYLIKSAAVDPEFLWKHDPANRIVFKRRSRERRKGVTPNQVGQFFIRANRHIQAAKKINKKKIIERISENRISATNIVNSSNTCSRLRLSVERSTQHSTKEQGLVESLRTPGRFNLKALRKASTYQIVRPKARAPRFLY